MSNYGGCKWGSYIAQYWSLEFLHMFPERRIYRLFITNLGLVPVNSFRYIAIHPSLSKIRGEMAMGRVAGILCSSKKFYFNFYWKLSMKIKEVCCQTSGNRISPLNPYIFVKFWIVPRYNFFVIFWNLFE